jgi:ABC-type glycerol-3-phosphate transport system permease component
MPKQAAHAVAQQARSTDLGPRARRWAVKALIYALLTLAALSMLFPFMYMVVNAFKPATYFYQQPHTLIPRQVTLQNFVNAFTYGQVGTYLYNSTFYGVTVAVVQLLTSSLAAYAFARLSFSYKNALFMILLSTIMLPGAVTIIPTYIVVFRLGLANTVLGVVLPGFASVFGIFLLRQFFLNVPRELDDAALVDGCGRLRIWWQIILPIAKPAMVTLGVLTFLGEYSSYLWPLIVLSKIELYPISVGISLFQRMGSMEWPLVFAASTVASLPLIVIFIVGQSYLIGGISLSGLKG